MVLQHSQSASFSQPCFGWQEFGSFPELGIPLIKMKVDTGAKTSSLHAANIEPFEKDGRRYVRFDTFPLQRSKEVVVHCEAPLVDRRGVRSSNGKKETRWVIQTPISSGGTTWMIEVTLTDRRLMRFRMLLGRDGIPPSAVVMPSRRFCRGKVSPAQQAQLYAKISSIDKLNK